MKKNLSQNKPQPQDSLLASFASEQPIHYHIKVQAYTPDNEQYDRAAYPFSSFRMMLSMTEIGKPLTLSETDK